ncbi:expressed protein [Aureococcus anophagefferens]|uniref:Expressed protein n=1 Tax=Aureococcus anophagefferens TaxID=44056 RepID=F0XX59_AURAN|nr:expressed protein [Aureococcus anophagefferens]EGB12517.1 expressed protein [Aureococcus anophagefferens]|eukprot:XP_009032191.1 expressed protein [Aureococcus anophagefferens]
MDLEVDSLGDAPSLEWKKSARRRSSTGSRKVPRRSVLSESTNRHNNAADDAEADSDGDLCHKTDPERGETWLARWGELVDALPAIDDDVPPDAFRGAARELLRRGVEIVDAADAEDAAGRDALVLRFVDGPEGRVSLPPPFDDPFSFANDYLPLYGPLRGFQVDAIAALHERRDVLLAVRCGAGKSLPPAMVAAARARDALDRGAQQVCVWTAPTQALVADKVDDLQGRYGEGWRNAGGRGDFAAAVAGLERAGARDDDGDVVFDYADAAASSSTSASTARHPVLAAISAKACDVAVLVMCPEMLAEHAAWFVLAARAGIISLVVIDECDEEVGNDDSFRRSQEAQGRTIQACFALAGAKAPVVALSGTLSKFEVGSLLEALGLPPAPATLVIRTASPINSMVDIHTGEADDEDPDGYGAPCASPLDHVAVSPPAPVTQRPVGTAFQLELARDSCEPPPTALATRRAARRAGSDAQLAKALGMAQEGPNALLVAASAAISDATAPAEPGAGDEADRATMRRAETLLRRQKSALVAERDGAAAEHAHLCQEKVRVLKSSTAKMQDLKATIKQCNAALRKNQKDSNVVQARRKAAELQDRLRAATAAEPEADGAVERDPDDEIRITDGEPVFSDADDSDGDFGDA